jgi:predicted nucleic acid-binding protein
VTTAVYLVDTDVISNARRRTGANPGVLLFFRDVATQGIPLFLSAVTIGELRQGVEAVRHRGDLTQATRLSRWLGAITRDYADAILPFDEEIAQIWGRLRVPHAENPLDKQIAATALVYGLTIVTRNVRHYEPTGVAVLNPFT